jgi:predicted Zn finger-like uncharacterized protein
VKKTLPKRRGAVKRPKREPPERAASTPSIAPPAAEATLKTAGRLYTQCPLCQTTYRITVAQLRAGRGEAQCQQCQASFMVLDSLADNPARAKAGPSSNKPAPLLGRLEAVAQREPAVKAEPEPAPPFPAESSAETEPAAQARPALPVRIAWAGGALALLILLAVQLVIFEGSSLAQNEAWRPRLEAACQWLACQLPPFRDLSRIQIIDDALNPAADGSEAYEFTLVFANQAALPQAFPAIKLILEAHNGSPAAVRVFQPEDYLPAASPGLIATGQLHEIHLRLAKPQSEVGGFSFELQ